MILKKNAVEITKFNHYTEINELSRVLFITVSIEFFTVTPIDFWVYSDMLKNLDIFGLLYKKVLKINLNYFMSPENSHTS